jgi:predicted NAD/FAD-binding protein
VTRSHRHDLGVDVQGARGRSHRFDALVIATHSDQALAMLGDASPKERAVLGAIRYAPNDVYLHRDPRLMPKRKAAWSSWNVLKGDDPLMPVAVTYWMNALQKIDAHCPLFVSLNPPFAPREDLTFGRFNFDHPQYDRSALAAQEKLEAIQGVRRTWFCGAWTGHGFHEDGLRSGLAVAETLGATIPWRLAERRFLEAAE